MKYEVPTMEIVKFEFKNNILTASEYIGGNENTGGFGGGDAIVPDEEDPFA